MIPRSVEANDAHGLAAVHAECFDRPWPAADLAAFSARPGACALLIEAGGGLAGFILCWIVAGEAEVLTLAVGPAARHQGFGRALAEAALRLCGQAGAEAMWLEVAEDNAAALALYAACGFTPAGRRPGYYDRGPAQPAIDAVVLRRTLNSGGSNSYPGL